MNVFDCRQEKNMTQIFETRLHFTAGIHGEVGTVLRPQISISSGLFAKTMVESL